MRRIFKRKKPEKTNDYDPKRHGPLVEVPEAPGTLETYSVRGPWVNVRIREDPRSGERLYEVFEPKLSNGDKKKMGRLRELLVETLDFDVRRFERDGKIKYLGDHIYDLIAKYEFGLAPKSRESITYYLLRDFQGHGSVDPLMRDERIEDISCDGPHSPVFIYHREHGPLRTNIAYGSEEQVQSAVVKLAQKAGKHISVASPLVDATLPDGSRLQLSFGGRVTTRGSTYTIRKFRQVPYSPVELVNYGTLSPELFAYLWLAVDAGSSILFAGGTASGKTTTLNAVSLFISPESKVVSIEDTRELNIPHENWIPGLTRGGFGSGEGEIDMFDLLKAGVRQRPDYLLVGEVRGKEAYVLFQGMATGHTTLGTIHAESADGVFRRLRNPPMNVSLSLLESLDIIVIQASVKIKGKRARRVIQVAECTGVDYKSGEIHTEDVFKYDAARDRLTFTGSPRVFGKASKGWSLSVRGITEEFKRREAVIKNAVDENLTDYRGIWKRIVEYRSKHRGTVGKE